MGLHADVYRAAAMPDCTNGGISSRYDTLCIVNASGPFEPTAGYPPVILCLHPTMPGIVRAAPAYFNEKSGEWEPIPVHHMMGGNFLYTSDSRLREKVTQMLGRPFYGAIAIHDRLE